MKKKIVMIVAISIAIFMSVNFFFANKQKMKVVHHVKESMSLINAQSFKQKNVEVFILKEGTIFIFTDEPVVFIKTEKNKLSLVLEKCRLELNQEEIDKIFNGDIVEKNGFYYAKTPNAIGIWS